jgi:hypothetical protein
VQIRRVKRELHRISNVPRTLVDETKFTTSGGRVQLGENVLEAEAVWRRRNGSNKDRMLLSPTWQWPVIRMRDTEHASKFVQLESVWSSFQRRSAGRDALTGFERSGIAYVIGELVIKL